MDERKKHELEELRKQIDPTILNNMVKYLGDDDENAHNGPSVMALIDATIPAERQRSNRARIFQERVRRRKMQEQNDGQPRKDNHLPSFVESVLVYCSNPVWLQIMQNNMRQLGFRNILSYNQFQKMFVQLNNEIVAYGEHLPVIAVSGKDIVPFIIEWEGIKRNTTNERFQKILLQIHVLFIIADSRQASVELKQYFGENHILCIQDRFMVNRAKLGKIFSPEQD